MGGSPDPANQLPNPVVEVRIAHSELAGQVTTAGQNGGDNVATLPPSLQFQNYDSAAFPNSSAAIGTSNSTTTARQPKFSEVIANHKIDALLQRGFDPAWEADDISQLATAVLEAKGAVAPWDLAERLKTRGEPFAAKVFAAIAAQHNAADPHPIALFHGFGGAPHTKGINPEIIAALRERGYTVYELAAPPFAPPETRAPLLAKQLEMIWTTGASKVHCIAHSLGGMDVRYLISTMGLQDRIPSVLTLGTPHHGSPAADKFAGAVPEWAYRILDPIGQAIGAFILHNPQSDKVDVRGLVQSMTTEGAKRFNAANPDRNGVFYQSVAGEKSPSVANPLLALADLFVGPGDGAVPVHSAQWGRHSVVQATHNELRGGGNLNVKAFLRLVQKDGS